MAKELIFSSAKKTIYRDGDTVIKEVCEGFPKAEVLNEALCNARVETIEALNVPKILGFTSVDGRWALIKEYVPGRTLEELMEENPDKLEEYMEQMVDLHLHSCTGMPPSQQAQREDHAFLKDRGAAGRQPAL